MFALKRLIASDKESKEEIENEIQILQDLNPHPHIMKFISWGLINHNVYLLLRYLYDHSKSALLIFALTANFAVVVL